MRKLIATAWMTLDGVFDADTMETWFMPYESDERGESIRDLILTSDGLVMGRTTYEMLAAYWSTKTNNEEGIAKWLNEMPKYVVSSKLKEATWNNSTVIKDAVAEIGALKTQPGRDLLITGSSTLVQSLMKTDLIDEYRFLVQPIIMGTGKRFFREGMDLMELELAKQKTFDFGVQLLNYRAA
jgi:dihydrofolate reductase